MSSGRIVQIIGAVIDVEFPRDGVPKVYDALTVDDKGLVLEVQQQLGDGVVRTIAMGSSEGVSRGLGVTNTGKPIAVPVGQGTLGRIMDVLGNPIDEGGPVAHDTRMPIHRAPPSYADQSSAVELLETGIKVIDLIMPIAKGGKVGLFGGAGVGKTVTLMELIKHGGRARDLEEIDEHRKPQQAEDDRGHGGEVVDVDLDEIRPAVLRRELFQVDRRRYPQRKRQQ
ncbi:MAG: hypothetical protein AMXMBFR26_10730 [Porticoccaceae bacterium]